MKQILTIFALLTYCFTLNAAELSFQNGKLSYESASSNVYSRGEIRYGKYKIPYDRTNVTKRGNIEEYMFGIHIAVSKIFPNADILPGSIGTMIVEDGYIKRIEFGHTILGEEGKGSIPLKIGSFILTEKGITELKNGFFELNDLIKIEVEDGAIKGITENWGKSKYFYNEQYNKEFSFAFSPLNLEPTLTLNGKLNVSPQMFSGEGDLGISIFRERMSINDFQFPDFLTKGNPYKIYGAVSFDKLTNVFTVSTKKEINSGNLTLSGKKQLMVTADIETFGAKLSLEGKIDYRVGALVQLMQTHNVGLSEVSKFTQGMPADEQLLIWTLQHFMTNSEIEELHNSGKNLKKSIELTVIVGYDPEYISKGKDYLDWNVLKIDMEFDGEKRTTDFNIK